MSLYLDFRSQNVGGPVIEPRVLEGDGTVSPLALRLVDENQIRLRVAGKNVLFGVHGFNVSRECGARSMGELEPQLALATSDVFIGVLWPGDWWLPVVNYPFEGEVSMDCGRKLAAFCRRCLAQAQSISFASHSLGARLVLEAVKNLSRPARVVCLTAAAINRNALSTEYAAATANAAAISLLASRSDWVLKLAFPVGDPIADLLHEDHTPFEPALGYTGPPVPASPPITQPWQIPDAAEYGHLDYLPAGSGNAKWVSVADFMARAFRGEPQSWP